MHPQATFPSLTASDSVADLPGPDPCMANPATLPAPTRILNTAQRELLRTLLYFDLFRHPLRAEEVRRFLGIPARTVHVERELAALHDQGAVEHADGFFSLADVDAAVEKRREENARAAARMARARRMSRFIGRFPFVRGVMLSGSLSKGCLAADGDIDYFVITSPGRLWIARTLLISFKKVFLLNSRRDFCVNYFVDTEHLPIEDRNLFTATELLTLVPTFGTDVCAAFFAVNTWASDLLPNATTPDPAQASNGHGLVKRALERLFRNGFGDELDEWLMHRTVQHWRARFPEMDRARFDRAMRSRRYVSKHHPRDFQRRVLEAFEQRLALLERELGTSLR